MPEIEYLERFNYSGLKMKRVSAFVVLLMITVAVNAQESKKTTMGTFTQAEMSQWKERSFKKNTNYYKNC